MQLGIIGLPMVGKTTIFELLTEGRHKGGSASKANSAIARIPDYRIDYLSELYKPKKTTYAQLEVVDIPGLAPGNEKGASVFWMQLDRRMRCCMWFVFSKMIWCLW